MELPTKLITGIGAVGTALATLWGGTEFVDNRYAKQGDFVMVEMRLDQKILTDRRTTLRERMRDIEQRYGEDLFDAPGPMREQYKTMKDELADLDQEINGIQRDYRSKGSSANRYYERKMDSVGH